jgi:hypothetical protein
MKKLSFLLLLIAPLGLLAQPADFKKIIGELGSQPHQHPYLIFSAEEKPAMLQRFKEDRRSSELYEKFLLEGRRLLYATVEREGPAREIHTRYLGSDEYRRFVTEHLDAAFTLAFLYQMTGDQAYVAKAFEHANVVCAQESWVQSAHYFDVIYPRVWPYGAKDDEVAFTYDISASGTTQRMAYIYDWLYPALTKAQRDRIRGALLEKAIMRVRGNYEYLWWATAYKCNWSGICHTGLGMAALALLDEDPQLTDVVARSCEGISSMLDHVGEDGGWQEGRGYWAYGLGESVRFIEALKRTTGGKVNLYKHRAISPHPVDFGLFGLTGGFGDGSGAPVGESYIMNKLTQETGDPVAAWYTKNFLRPLDTIYDLIWPATSVRAEKPAEASKLFRSIDWAVMRKDFGSDFMTVATKAGMNDDPHHGHLDCGSFNITWQNIGFVGEVPRTPYDEKYFGEMRWTYLQARTSGHNVVMVNGEEQICAKLKDQPWKSGIGGHITHYHSEPGWAALAMDPTHAYPGKELKLWNRWLVLDKDRNITIAVDKVGCAVGSQIEVRYHPGVEFEAANNHVTLHAAAAGGGGGGGGRQAAAAQARERTARPVPPEMEHRYADAAAPNVPDAAPARSRRTDLEMIPLFNGEYSIVQGRQADLPITEEPRPSWVPYFSTSVKAPAEENVIASVFCPADLKAAGAEFKLGSENGAPSITYTVNGKATKFVFFADRVTRTEL